MIFCRWWIFLLVIEKLLHLIFYFLVVGEKLHVFLMSQKAFCHRVIIAITLSTHRRFEVIPSKLLKSNRKPYTSLLVQPTGRLMYSDKSIGARLARCQKRLFKCKILLNHAFFSRIRDLPT